MKKIEAFIRHEAFEPIRMELLELGFPSLSISEVKGSGRQKGITERYRGAELTNWLRPKVKLECVVASGDVQTVVDAILKHARTGSIGDGKVFILPVEEAYRIRTGESGEETLQAHPGVAAQAASVEALSRRRMRGAAHHSRPACEGGVLNVAMEAQPEDRGATVMERVRAVHLRMVDAVLGGDGLEGVATLAAGETGGVVAIVVPRLGAAAASGPVGRSGGAAPLRRRAGARARGRRARRAWSAEVPIATGDEQLGAVLLLGERRAGRRTRWSSCTSPRSPA